MTFRCNELKFAGAWTQLPRFGLKASLASIPDPPCTSIPFRTPTPPSSVSLRFLTMNIQLRDLPFSATVCDVKRAFAAILHNPPFHDPENHRARRMYAADIRSICRLIDTHCCSNFEVILGKTHNGLPNDGTATLTIPDVQLGRRLASAAVRFGGERIQILGRPIYVSWAQDRPPPRGLIERLNKTAFVDPEEDTQRIRKLDVIKGLRILVDAVQFGVFFRHPNDSYKDNRTFSIEYQIRQEDTYVGEVTYDYNHKLLRVEVCGACV